MKLAVVKRFELVVVRGNEAKNFLASHGIKETVAIITGSVKGCQLSTQPERKYHMIFVGRLAPTKQPEQFIEIVRLVANRIPSIRAVIVGDGPLMVDLQGHADRLGISNNIEFLGKRKDVEDVLACSGVFVLTSISEGLSIAMAEAMSAGVVPVVADVGELGDLVKDGINGNLIEPNNIEAFAKNIVKLQQNQLLLEKFSQKASESALKYSGIKVVSEKWQKCLQDAIAQASNTRVKDVVK